MPSKEEDSILDSLDRESKEYDKDAEISRILSAFRLDAYAILDLQPGVPESDIKITYRKKSLLIHPDKTKNPQAPEAFDRLKKAESELMDEKLRLKLDEAIADARMLLIREKKWTTSHPELLSDEFKREWRDKSKDVLIDNEMRRRRQVKAQMQEEGRAQRKEEEEVAERKRKREVEVRWEASREERIGSWRDFQKGKKSSSTGFSGDGISAASTVVGTTSNSIPTNGVGNGNGIGNVNGSMNGEKPKKKKTKLKVLA